MKKIKAIGKKLILPAAIFGGVVVVAAISRAISIKRNAGTEGIEVPAGSMVRYIILELKEALKFSRYQ